MASWKEKVGNFAQNAVAKSKEVAETTRLSVENSGLESKLKDNYNKLGEYLLNNIELLPAEDEFVAGIIAAVGEIRGKIEANRQQIAAIKNANVCPNCGTDVGATSRFCPSCGTPIERASVQPEEVVAPVCPDCGEPLAADAVFCVNCGKKLGE